MKNVYLALAILGAAIPYFYFVQHMGAEGLVLSGFIAEAFANPVASGFTADLLISSLVFWIYMFKAEADAPRPWAFIAINLLIGLSCALPAYLHKAPASPRRRESRIRS
jgi:hypothetical protein